MLGEFGVVAGAIRASPPPQEYHPCTPMRTGLREQNTDSRSARHRSSRTPSVVRVLSGAARTLARAEIDHSAPSLNPCSHRDAGHYLRETVSDPQAGQSFRSSSALDCIKASNSSPQPWHRKSWMGIASPLRRSAREGRASNAAVDKFRRSHIDDGISLMRASIFGMSTQRPEKLATPSSSSRRMIRDRVSLRTPIIEARSRRDIGMRNRRARFPAVSP